MSEKLVSADYLFAKIDKWVLDCDGISFEELKKTLNNAPAVDAVEVVRCFRCRFAVNKKENGEFVTYCALDWGMRGVLDPNDYCSYGKEIKRCQD